ncbi:MAG: hypothetical protein RAP03_16375, partial [Candidatus Electryonea clarkiae]|nr:hypothetical protein [Candidatus Electryonea clarkiae]
MHNQHKHYRVLYYSLIHKVLVIIRFVIFFSFLNLIPSGFADILNVPADYNSIQIAINAATLGDTVLIAPGFYEEQLVIEDAGITLASRYILNENSRITERTVLSGDNQFRPLTIEQGVLGEVHIIGLKFTDGMAFWARDGSGGAISAVGAEIWLTDCIIQDNSAEYVGGVDLDSCSGYISNNRFESNSGTLGGGALLCSNGFYIVESNVFRNNFSDSVGGGIIITNGSTGRLTENIFDGNYAVSVGGAARINNCDSGVIVVQGNIFRNNTSALQGGAFYASTLDTLIVKNNVFRDNTVVTDDFIGFGGALDLIDPINVAVIDSNNFYSNYADNAGGAVWIRPSSTIRNNVFSNNQAPKTSAVVSFLSDEGTEVIMYGNLFVNNSPPENDEENYCGAITAYRLTTLLTYENDFIGNTADAAALSNLDWNIGTMLVEDNYWGHSSGPYHEEQNPDGIGDSVDTRLDIIPFATERFTEFEPPVEFDLISPDTDAINDTYPVNFSWNATTDPNDEDDELRYTLEISLSEDFEQSMHIPAGTETSIDVSCLIPDSSYHWRVYAEDKIWMRTFSTETRVLHITGDGFMPGQFSLASPADNDTNDTFEVLFTWNSTVDPNEGDTVVYIIELARNDDFVNSDFHLAGTDTSIAVSGFDRYERNYWWKVYAEDDYGLRTYSTETYRVFITNEGLAPEPFDLGEPIDSSIIEDDTIHFTWHPSSDFTLDDEVSYVLLIAPFDEFEQHRRFGTGEDTFKTLSILELETVYRWQVIAEDIAGHITDSNQSHLLFYGNIVASKQFEGIPKTWELSAVYPNPFNPVVRVVVGVPKSGIVKAEIYDILGRSVSVLIDDKLSP